jgi:hypothetical protein
MPKNSITTSAKVVLVGILVVGGSLTPAVWRVVRADTMSSDSYKITSDVISIGGNRSDSGSYTIEDTIGETSSGENLSSASFLGCSGYLCFLGESYISFTVKAGPTAPGDTGGIVDMGTLTSASVFSSNGTTVNSIFITAETNSAFGSAVTVTGANGGLASVSYPTDLVSSVTDTITAGTEGFGICVESASQGAESPSAFDIDAPYASSCDKSSGHDVGIVDSTNRIILDSNAELAAGEAEILVKGAISTLTPAHPDYSETLTFIYTATY